MMDSLEHGSLDDAVGGQPRRTRKASAAITALDEEVRRRYARRTDSMASFLMQWIKLDESQSSFFAARGDSSENYLQFELSIGEVEVALAITQMCQVYAESTDSARVIEFLNHIDRDGNDIWHYLADNLTAREDDDSLEIAKILIQLDIDYCRKNDKDESPLARLLIPEPKWMSINSLMQAKTLTIGEIESSFSASINQNLQVKGGIMVSVLTADLLQNDARLVNHLLYQAMAPKTEKMERAVLARAFFEYAGGKRQESVLMTMMETDYDEVVDKMLAFLQRVAEDAFAALAATDLQLAKANQQVYIYRRLGRRNRLFQSILNKGVSYNKPGYVAAVLRMLRNEDLQTTKRNSRGETEREMLMVDKTSAAPFNPAMSLLLMMDARGNLPFHNAILGNRLDCLRKMFYGLSVMDSFVMMTRVPNRFGLTCTDLLNPQQTYAKLAGQVKAQRLTIEEAQPILQASRASIR
jgi:hypothetical protein